jgi:hypothetical protein
MTFNIILQSVVLAVAGSFIFTLIGVIPGTDETATMAPLTLILVLLGVEPIALFAWFISIMQAIQIAHTIPTAMSALPGSTTGVPMVAYTSLAKQLGIPHISMRKLAAGSVVGGLIAVPLAIVVAYVLAPLGDYIQPYVGLVFTLGAILIAYMSKAKWGAVIALIPVSFLIQGMQRLAIESVGHTLFISIFMGITIGPMISELFNVLIPKLRDSQRRDTEKSVWLAPEPSKKLPYFPNPFSLLTKKQRKTTVGNAGIATAAFLFSPVGMIVLLGEIVAGRTKELYEKITSTLSVQDAVSNATYIGGLIIPLLAFGLPLSPVALGPAAPLFNAPPRFTVDPVIHNISSYLDSWHYVVFGIFGILAGSMFAYPIAIRKARSWTEMMFKYISHEALIGTFLGLIFMLAFYEAGIVGIVVTLVIGLFAGILHNLFDVHTGVQFMAYYASGFIVTNILALANFL